MTTRHSWFSRPRAAAAFCSLALAILTSPATLGQQAQQPSAQAGHQVAQRLCVGCHVIDEDARGSVPVGIATFRGIANRSGQTGQKIMDALIAPQHPMPDMHLSIEEIADVIAYLETLRSDRSSPALIGPAVPAIKRVPPARS